jgi:hypothetical protein
MKKKLLKLAVVLAITGGIAAVLVWKFYVNKEHEDIDAATPVFSMTTEEIWKQYNDYPRNADSLYTGKVIELSGNLSRIDKNDSLVSVVFVMAADSMFGDKTISCLMYLKHNDEVAALSPGSQVKIKGYCTGFNDPDIKFNKCSVVK